MAQQRNIPPSTSILGQTAGQPKLVPSIQPLSVGNSQSRGGHAPARRRGRPRGPERAMLSVRILAENDRKLTAAVDQTGLNPQTIVDQALEAHFKRLKIKDPQDGTQGDPA